MCAAECAFIALRNAGVGFLGADKMKHAECVCQCCLGIET